MATHKDPAHLELLAASGNIKVALNHLANVVVDEVEGTECLSASTLDNISHAFDHLRAARALLQVPLVRKPGGMA